MEGVGSEAASLAGHLGLDNLCWVYDNNHITIEGSTSITFTEDVAARFLGYGWNVLRVGDANDIERIEHALEVFRRDARAARPSSSSTATSATARRTSRTRPRRTASRSATTRSGSPSASTAGPRTRSSSCPTASTSTSRPASARAARRARAQWTELFAAYRAAVPRARDRDRTDAAARAAGRMGPEPARLPGRREGHRRTRRLGQGAERARAEHPLVPRRLGGSRAVEQDDAHLRGRRATSRPRPPAGRTCTSASASTRWRRS